LLFPKGKWKRNLKDSRALMQNKRKILSKSSSATLPVNPRGRERRNRNSLLKTKKR